MNFNYFLMLFAANFASLHGCVGTIYLMFLIVDFLCFVHIDDVSEVVHKYQQHPY